MAVHDGVRLATACSCFCSEGLGSGSGRVLAAELLKRNALRGAVRRSQCLYDAALSYGAAAALLDDATEFAPQGFETRNLAVDICQVLACDGIDRFAGAVFLVRQAKQLSNLFDRKAKIAGPANEA